MGSGAHVLTVGAYSLHYPCTAYRHIAALLHDLMQREMQEARGIKLAHLALAGHAVWLGHDLQVEGCRVLVEGFQVTQGGGTGNGDHVHINVAQ